MGDFAEALTAALRLIVTLDAGLVEIIALSLQVTVTAVVIACLIGVPLGGFLAIGRAPGRRALIVLVNAFMGLPPVVVGLAVYLLLSASGPFGVLDLLYTPTAMIIAQTIIVTPIIAALTRQALADMSLEYDELLRSMRASRLQIAATLLWDARPSLATAALAGLGRALAEVGAVMIVGGNINHATRTMTTAIALETSRGALSMAMALGLILISLTIAINAGLLSLRGALGRGVVA
ncbi:MAG: ABC transporter permease [Alphaproteobacteria bacterium]|nr:ABC transporter permease [Alphaproteobacteria bacterium]